MNDEEIKDGQHEALQRFAETRRQEAEESEIIEPASKYLERSVIYITAVALAAGLLLVTFGEIDVIVTTRGKIEPRTELIPVQSRNTGVISDVRFAVGETVEQGDLLMRLGGESMQADLASLERGLELAIADHRRKAKAAESIEKVAADFDQLSREDFNISKSGAAVELIHAVRVAALEVERSRHLAGPDLDRLRSQTQARIAGLNQTAEIKRQNLEIAEAELTALTESHGLRKEQLANISALMAQGITTRTRVIEARDRVLATEISVNDRRELLGELRLKIAGDELQITELELELAAEARVRQDRLFQAELALNDAKAAVVSYLSTLQAEVQELAADIERRRDDLRLARVKAGQLEIRAPASGTIASLAFASPGSRVVEGVEVARLVPEGVANVVSASLPSRDVGRVRIGQRAIIKLDAYPFYRFGTVPATVAAVFPRPGARHFTVRLEPDRPTIRAAGQEERIAAGLDATVEIVTERRRIIEVLFNRGARAISGEPAGTPEQEIAAGERREP